MSDTLNYPDCLAEIAEHECRHDRHGYSQPNRAGIGTGGPADETITLSDGTQVKISSGDKDCSSLMVECVAAMGLPTGGATYTGNMRRGLTSTGNFEWHGRGDLGSLRRGDILLNERHHTAMYLGSGRVGMASQSEHGTVTGTRGDQTGREIYIRDYYDCPWDGFLRCTATRVTSRWASVQLYDGNATDAQRWGVAHNDDGTVTLVARSCGLALDVMNGGTASGTPVQAYTPNGTDAQRWHIYQKSGEYVPDHTRPVALAPKLNAGLRLDCVAGGTANGTGIQVYDRNDTPAQQWQILDHGDGTWTLVNVGSSQALDVVGGGN